MTDRELFIKALNALETQKPFWVWTAYRCEPLEIQDAITALRDRLAQLEQEPVADQPLPCPFCGHIGLDFSDGNTYRWGIASCGGCGASRGDIRREYPDEGKWHSEAIAEWNRRTTPPQRKSLTDEVISNIWCKVSNTDFVTADTHEFARAIEAAHGIKP